MLDKALDLLNESHEQECSAIKNEIENGYNSGNSQWQTNQSNHRGVIELPNEILTLDKVNEGIK